MTDPEWKSQEAKEALARIRVYLWGTPEEWNRLTAEQKAQEERRKARCAAAAERARRREVMREDKRQKQLARERAAAALLARMQSHTLQEPEPFTYQESMGIAVELASILAAVADDWHTREWERGW